MKKYMFMAVAGMLALSSCSNDDNDIQDVQNAPRQMTFTAGYNEGGETRATLNGSTKKVSFDANDKISILSAKNTNTQFTTSAGGASATFSGTATDDSKFYAVYPYTAGLTLSGDVISGVNIPNDQTDAASSGCGWDPNAAIAYATTTGSSLQFHNACALLKVTNNTGEVVDIMIVKGSGEGIAGEFNLDTSTGALTCTSHYSGVDVYGVPNNKTIYIAVAPGTYGDFSASTFTSLGLKRKEKSSVTFVKGKIYNLGNVNDWDGF